MDFAEDEVVDLHVSTDLLVLRAAGFKCGTPKSSGYGGGGGGGGELSDNQWERRWKKGRSQCGFTEAEDTSGIDWDLHEPGCLTRIKMDCKESQPKSCLEAMAVIQQCLRPPVMEARGMF